MRYDELIQFQPIETVIQIREADDRQQARHLVRTYVISERMADQLANLVIPNLQIARPADNKGVLIVGNYGTGKSHLMSVISAVAEHADLAAELRHETVRAAAGEIAGRFKVWRTEIGGVEKSLRDIILDELEVCLAEAGIPYSFPAADQVGNNKDAIIAAMAAFNERHPDQGLLLVVDELLDYLRTRADRALILDLGFLRELGEVVELTPFRFIAGLQETLFDNPRFSFVAEQLRRVRDRFAQVRIAREDIAFVVSERLLRKTDEQLARVTDHLRAFSPLYPHLADHLGEYARLFPIHPAYLDAFERVYIAEKREVLKTFSLAIRALLAREVPAEETGLVSYDHYWDVLRENPALRTLPGVSEVVEKSNVLEGRVKNAYTRPQLQAMALRIIHGLSVHRLTTSDIYTPLGQTAEELRDSLCLWLPLPEQEAEFLADTVRTALREIMRTVSGQYITLNDENGQYYLDVKKDIDFDARIAERGDFMGEEDLNKYFYDALRPLLGLPASVYVSGYQIWSFELPWAAAGVTRPGYIFFGAPAERSTAQPPRDFYVYLLPPYRQSNRPRAPLPHTEADEVLFSFHALDAEFDGIVRRYAGARALAGEAATHRDAYENKANDHLRALSRWLRQHFNSHVRVTYRGVTHTIPEALARTPSSASQDIEALVSLIAAHFLMPHFQDSYPHYPHFNRLPRPIGENAREASALDAIRYITRGARTALAIGVLEGLQLLDEEERIKPLRSPYARFFLEKLTAKDNNQVVNRGEVISQMASNVHPVYKDPHFLLEPEWVVTVLLALVYDGQIVLHLGGRESLDAGNIGPAATLSMHELADFRYYGRPRDLPLPVWLQIFEGLGLQASLVREERNRDQAVRDLQKQVQAELEQVASWQHAVQQGLRLWNTSLFTDRIEFSTQAGQVVEHSRLPEVTLSHTDIEPALRKTKEFLETLARFNTPGKLRNLQISAVDAGEFLRLRRRALQIAALIDAIARLQPATAYLAQAQALLPQDHPWRRQARDERETLLNDLRGMAQGEQTLDLLDWQRRLHGLKEAYIAAYGELHRTYVLAAAGDERRGGLLGDGRMRQLQTLAGVDILPRAELAGRIQALDGIKVCREFHEGLLADAALCPACEFRPAAEMGRLTAYERLDELDERLGLMLHQWHAALRQNLGSETAQHSLAGMTPAERRPLEAYLALDDPVAAGLPPDLVPAANQALRGIDTVALQLETLVAALKQGGLPCTSEELVSRFHHYVHGVMRGHDTRNTRITIEE